MRVVVNRMAALGQKTGVGHYTSELLRCLHEQVDGNEAIHEYPEGWVRRARETWSRARPRLEAAGGRHKGVFRSGLASVRAAAIRALRDGSRLFMTTHFRWNCPRSRFDLYHETNFIPFPTDVQTVSTILDLSVPLHPEWHPADRVRHFEQHFHRSLGYSSHFLAISEAGRQEIIRHLGIAPERVTRTYMGIRPNLGVLPKDEITDVLRRLNLPSRYLLHVGTMEPRKNLLLLMQAYCGLPEAVRSKWPLLLVGGWGWNTGPLAEYFHNEARHRGVIHLGYVEEQYVAAIYNGARALVFPTLYEGFGLPPIEMMACGGAVIASTAEAVAEVAGRRAHLVHPNDRDGWRDAMLRVVTDDEWWQSLRQGVQEVARPFTWDACAADTLRVYRQLTSKGVEALPRAA